MNDKKVTWHSKARDGVNEAYCAAMHLSKCRVTR
jgi:hypothetical protein